RILPSSNVSYDFDLEPPTSSFKKPNFCNDCVCGIGRQQQGTTRIINGNITNILDYPWIVSLNIKGNLFCAGSVITRKHILTAAHCVQGYDIKTITLILMDSDRPFI
ncbi:CUB and peptidase domain-containing protein 2-like, partial [Pogonomyrmex barbatus]|uniref:CUB and peptidase domain-containing protein 2-like n=1 Tax=Pogonomyrmex barbatus TaxID=144034 RepID=A0A6I9X596_9HYME